MNSKSKKQQGAELLVQKKTELGKAWNAGLLERTNASPFEWTIDLNRQLAGSRWVVEVWVDDVWMEGTNYLMQATYIEENMKMLLKVPDGPLISGTNRPFSMLAVVEVTEVSRYKFDQDDEAHRTIKGNLVAQQILD